MMKVVEHRHPWVPHPYENSKSDWMEPWASLYPCPWQRGFDTEIFKVPFQPIPWFCGEFLPASVAAEDDSCQNCSVAGQDLTTGSLVLTTGRSYSLNQFYHQERFLEARIQQERSQPGLSHPWSVLGRGELQAGGDSQVWMGAFRGAHNALLSPCWGQAFTRTEIIRNPGHL